jgi:hypothetical protein
MEGREAGELSPPNTKNLTPPMLLTYLTPAPHSVPESLVSYNSTVCVTAMGARRNFSRGGARWAGKGEGAGLMPCISFFLIF